MATQDVMLDIETLSTSNDALVLSIGALEFALYEDGPVFGDHLLLVPNMVDQIIQGRHVDQKTQEFWAKQPAEASAHWKIGPAQSVYDVLTALRQFTVDRTTLWANGIVFDIGILESLYKDFNVPVPWKYNVARDARTIFRACPRVREPSDKQALEIMGLVAHHPVADCQRQVWSLWTNWPDKLDRLPAAVEAA